jgi:hypothetical protein
MDQVLASQRTMLRRMGKSGAELPEHRLASVYAQQMEAARAHLNSQPQFRTLEVDYGQCVANPQPTAKAVNQFLGGGLDESKMAGAVTPSLYRHRSP